jgi:hypothetical protein
MLQLHEIPQSTEFSSRGLIQIIRNLIQVAIASWPADRLGEDRLIVDQVSVGRSRSHQRDNRGGLIARRDLHGYGGRLIGRWFAAGFGRWFAPAAATAAATTTTRGTFAVGSF